MKIPLELRIGKATYRILLLNELDKSYAGVCYPEEKIILVDASQGKDEALATLWHEILHAIEQEHRITLGHPKIRKLEYALAQIFEQLE